LLPIGCVPIGWARSSDGSLASTMAQRFQRAAGRKPANSSAAKASGAPSNCASDERALARSPAWLVSRKRARASACGSPAADAGATISAIETDLWRASSPAPMDFAMAAGQGGQRLYIAPADGLVIVTPSAFAHEFIVVGRAISCL
jgi:hypothetical protein